MLDIVNQQIDARERYCEIKFEHTPKTVLKTIGKSDLVDEIYPLAATSTGLKKLAQMIRDNPDLRAQLRQAGYREGARNLTPRQADIIRQFVKSQT